MATTHTNHSAHDQTHASAHHVQGTMDVTVQERTFDGFVRIMTWGAAASILTLIFLALVNA